MTDQPEKLDLNSMDLSAEKKEELLRLFPEIRTEDGRIDFERLKLALGEMVDVGKERYGMNWPGKADCFRAIQTPSSGTLLPCPEESWPPKPYFSQKRGGSRGDAEKEEVHAEARRRGEERGAHEDAEKEINDSENLIIEGDNLEVLKLLQKAYLGKVKMIYIDPPYNTGNDFIYPDNYSESMQTYLEYTGQTDAAGKKFGTNSDTDGRFHSRWMNMMYPRLYLARNLLREDGVIFISIDDNEVANLRKLCDEIFGETSFLACVLWQKRTSPDARTSLGAAHDYVLCYVKIPIDKKSPLNLVPLSKERVSEFKNQDNDPRGAWASVDITGQTGHATSSQYYVIETPSGEKYPPPNGRCWAISKQTFLQLVIESRIWFGKDGNSRPRLKQFLSETKGMTTWTWWTNEEVGHNQEATKELGDLLGQPDIFDNPKPTRLIEKMLQLSTSNFSNDIILDFFAGSGSTAHAVLKLNKADEGNRKFVLVQLPEPTGREDYPTIADITEERVRRVIQKIEGEAEKAVLAEKKKQPDLFSSAPSASPREPDLGFRVFKLAESNFKAWNARAPQDAAALAKQLELHVDHLREERGADDILYEILLKSDFELTTPVEILGLTQGETKVAGYLVDGGRLLICLDEKLTMEAVQAMADLKPERVVCLDKGFEGNDQLKTNAVHIFRNAGIASFKTV